MKSIKEKILEMAQVLNIMYQKIQKNKIRYEEDSKSESELELQ